MAKREIERHGQPPSLPAAPPRNIQVSSALADAFRATTNPHPEVGPPGDYPTAVQTEADRVLAMMAPYAAPVSQDVVRMWLMPIQASVRNPADEDRLMGWIAAVMVAVGHLEAGAFTEETQRQALQTFDFFPSAADVYRLVSGPAVAIRLRCDALRRIVQAPTRDQAA